MDMDLQLVLCGLAVLLLRAGMALHVSGLSRSKNSAGAILRAVADLCVAVLAFWLIGAAVMNARVQLVAAGALRLEGLGELLPAALFFWLCVMSLAPAIAGGVVGERSRFLPMLALPLLLAAIAVPLCAAWAMGGWLARQGFIDLAGASFIHVVAGTCGLVAAILVGPRQGKYNRDGSANAIPGHSLTLASAGVLLMLVGWVGCLAGFSLLSARSTSIGAVALAALLAAAAGGLSSMLLCRVRYGKADIHLTYAGLLCALVAISAGAGTISPGAAVLVGAVAGLLAPTATLAIDLTWRIDDPSNAVAVHAIGGAWGLIATALFLPDAGLLPRLKVLGAQTLGLAVAVTLACVLALIVLATLKRVVGLRSREADEFDGLDLAEHDIGAYPDFQQTMIKSYHLRET